MTAKLRMLCHAATAATRNNGFPDDDPIEPSGIERLEAFASSLPRFDRIICAPARAAGQTASVLRLPRVEIESALRDLDYGRWKGRTLAAVSADDASAFASWTTTAEANPHGGESIAMLIERVGRWLDLGPFEGRLLAISHQAVLRAAIVHVLAAPATSFWAIDAGPLTVVDFSHDGRRWRLRCGPLQIGST